jgi:Uma2 family endonuclease
MMAIVDYSEAERRFLLRDVTWDTYCSLRDSPANLHIRMTYAEGNLEMMSPSRLHERLGYVLGRFIDVWTEELDIDVQSCRTMTFRRQDIERGLEPDNCYYIAHEPQVRDKAELDLTVDPPPDLAAEIDLSSSAINKLELYERFRVPEVWRYDGKSLWVYHLGSDGRYGSGSASRCFPDLPLEKIEEMLGQVTTVPETKLVRAFRKWVRSRKQA